MAIAQTIADFLIDHKVDYHVYPHDYSERALEAAERTKLNPRSVAKAVVIATKRQHKRNYCLVVLASDCEVDLNEIRGIAFQDVELACEAELADLFPDCEVGAIPALGEAYGLPTFIDRSITDSSEEIFFEAGDHLELIKISIEHLEELMPYAEFVSISKPHTLN